MIVKLNNNKDISKFKYYLNTLNLKSASNNQNIINYLYVKFKDTNETLIISIYDKRNYFDFDTTKNLNFNSNVRVSIFRNV